MATEQHRVLLIGAGSIGERHIRCFQSTGRAAVSFVEVQDQRRSEVAQRYGVEQSYATIDAALGAPHNAAVVATPAPLHIPMAQKLADAGVHLLIEKPLSTSLDGVEELEKVVAERQLVAAVGYNWRAIPAIDSMRRMVGQGRFGDVLQISGQAGQNFAFYRPAYRDIYYRDRDLGGGAIQDAMTHLLNAGEWIAGPIARLVADASHQALEGVDVEDTVHVLTRQEKALGVYSLNQYQAPNEATLTVVCERGTVRAKITQNQVEWVTQPESTWETTDFPKLERDDPYIKQAHAFLDAVEGKSPPLCPLDEGIQTLKVNLAVLASSEADGRWHKISPV